MNEYIEISELISNLVTNVIEPNIIPAFHILELDDGDKITLTINSNEFGEAQTITLKRYLKSDEKNNKTTYVSVKGLEQAQKDVAEYSKEAVTLLEELPYENEFLKELILNLIHRNA